MAKIYKATIYLTDANDNIEFEDVISSLDYLGSKLGVGVEVVNLKESEEFEWEDSLKINRLDSTVDDFEEYFKQQ
jgi:hypothetical protein